jgi:hypothetical protein
VSDDPGHGPPPPPVRIAGQVVANASLLVAILVYMGWAYDAAYLGYFHISPLDLNVGIVEYMLRSLNLFSPGVVLVAVGVIVVTAVRAWGLGRTQFARHAAFKASVRILAQPAYRRLVPSADIEQLHVSRLLLIGAGSIVTAIGLVLAWIANFATVNTYLVLASLGGGVLLLTWPSRAKRHGGFSYALAVVVAAVCTLWAAALYAHNSGTSLDDSGRRRGPLLIVFCRFSAVVAGWRVAVLPDVLGAAPAPTAPGRPPFRVAGTGWLVRRVRAGRTAAASRPGRRPSRARCG